MYTVESLQRKIKKEGIDKTIHDLSTANFPEPVKEQLTKLLIFIDGCPNLSLIYSLA